MNEKTETALSSDVTEVRAQKLKLLREQIGDVYPAHFHRTMTNAELSEKYAGLEPDTETTDIVTVAGRVYSSRNSGMFMDIHDASGKDPDLQPQGHHPGRRPRAAADDRHRRHHRRHRRGAPHQARRTDDQRASDHHADEVAAADAGKVAWPLRHRAALPQASPRHHDQRGIQAPLPAALQDRLRHPPFHGK